MFSGTTKVDEKCLPFYKRSVLILGLSRLDNFVLFEYEKLFL